MAKYIHRLRNKKGQQLIEMVIVLPVIILCIGIIITAGQIIFAKMTCQLAAYEGARKAVVVENYSSAKSAASAKTNEMMKSAIGVSNIKTTFGASSGGWKKPNLLTYTVQADVKTLFPVIGPSKKFSSTTTVKGSIVMMIERN